MAGLAGYTGCPEEMIVIGAGMDGVMDTLTRMFLEPGDSTFIPIPTFSYYEILTTMAGATPQFVPRGPDFGIPEEMPKEMKMAFLCSPNNPTGNAAAEEEVRAIAESTDAIVFLDEAYVEFADKSLLSLVKEYDNLIVGRTMSKAFGLAGMRLGYAVAPEWIADQYRRAAPPFFGVTCASVAAGVAALSDLEYMRSSVDKIKSERLRLQKATGSHPLPGQLPVPGDGRDVECRGRALLPKGIIIRDCRSFRGAGEHHVRVTVGTPDRERSIPRRLAGDMRIALTGTPGTGKTTVAGLLPYRVIDINVLVKEGLNLGVDPQRGCLEADMDRLEQRLKELDDDRIAVLEGHFSHHFADWAIVLRLEPSELKSGCRSGDIPRRRSGRTWKQRRWMSSWLSPWSSAAAWTRSIPPAARRRRWRSW